MSPGLRIAVLGHGAIGALVAGALDRREVPGASLVGVVTRTGETGFDEVLDRADVVVEAATQQALAARGPQVIAAGRRLLALSIGALADPELRRRLTRGPGRLYLSTGAIGGLEIIRALAAAGTPLAVRIETTKRASTLVQPWMSEKQIHALTSAAVPYEIMRGPVSEIVAAFPRSANVAATVAMAAGDWDLVEACVRADPAAAVTRHVVSVDSPVGSYRFEFQSRPSVDNPATSEIVPYAVLRALRDIAGRQVVVL